MKSLLKLIRAWRSRRQQRWLERWEQTRTEGKAQFIVRTALTNALTVVGVTHVYHYVFYGPTPIPVVHLIFYVLFGIGIGSDGWSTRERKYQNALREARAKALPANRDSLNVFNMRSK